MDRGRRVRDPQMSMRLRPGSTPWCGNTARIVSWVMIFSATCGWLWVDPSPALAQPPSLAPPCLDQGARVVATPPDVHALTWDTVTPGWIAAALAPRHQHATDTSREVRFSWCLAPRAPEDQIAAAAAESAIVAAHAAYAEGAVDDARAQLLVWLERFERDATLLSMTRDQVGVVSTLLLARQAGVRPEDDPVVDRVARIAVGVRLDVARVPEPVIRALATPENALPRVTIFASPDVARALSLRWNGGDVPWHGDRWVLPYRSPVDLEICSVETDLCASIDMASIMEITPVIDLAITETDVVPGVRGRVEMLAREREAGASDAWIAELVQAWVQAPTCLVFGDDRGGHASCHGVPIEAIDAEIALLGDGRAIATPRLAAGPLIRWSYQSATLPVEDVQRPTSRARRWIWPAVALGLAAAGEGLTQRAIDRVGVCARSDVCVARGTIDHRRAGARRARGITNAGWALAATGVVVAWAPWDRPSRSTDTDVSDESDVRASRIYRTFAPPCASLW